MQILVAALVAVLVFLQYMLWIDADGVRQTHALHVSVRVQTDENAALAERNKALEAEVNDLKNGLMAIEERARAEMGMVRRDETFYRILEQPPAKIVEAPTKPATSTHPGVATHKPAATATPARPEGQSTKPVSSAHTAKPSAASTPPASTTNHDPSRPTGR